MIPMHLYYWLLWPAVVAFPYDALDGYWGWDIANYARNYAGNRHEFTFDHDSNQMFIKYEHPATEAGMQYQVVHYKMLEETPYALRVRLIEPLDPMVDVVDWELFFTDRGYAWRRADWPPDAMTMELVRCEKQGRKEATD